MKKLFILFTLCLTTVSIHAKVIKVSDAMASAKVFCQQSAIQPDIINTSLELAYTETSAKDKNVNTLYVFNKPQQKGFIVVAADDVVSTPILGYSDNGTFDYENMPENLKWLLSLYSEQIDRLKLQGISYSNLQATSKPDSIIIPPLMGDMLWNQTAPFNNLCPTGCPTGCVATSMTTLMYFHKWPLVGQGSKTYTDTPASKQTFSVDFSKSHYDWVNILPRYTCEYTAAQATAVSKLSFDAGVSVEMMYSPSGSGTYSSLAKEALPKYFKYNSDVKYQYFNGKRENWNNTIKKELNAFRPVYYSGVSNDGGHAFVCDGYTNNDYFHFNFGWSGVGNGYYVSSLDSKHAAATSSDFSQQQQLVYNVQPDNKRLVDGIYYHILSSNEAEVCPPKTIGEYCGKIVIPDSVVIDATKYAVTRIGCAAFGKSPSLTSLTLPSTIKIIEGNSIFGCTTLDSLIVPWTTPLEVFSTTFYTDLTSRTKLIVPSGAIDKYNAAEGWNQFYQISDNKDESKEWTVWEPLKSGTCEYVQPSLFKERFYNLHVYQRTLVNDSTQAQIKIDGNNIFSAVNMVFYWNKKTNECQVEKQSMGYYQSNPGLFYVSDMPHYNKAYSYKSYPCKYNPDNGLFELYLVYFHDNTSYYGIGTDTIKIDGLAKDHSISLSPYAIQELEEDSATQNINLTLGTDVAYVEYITTKGSLNDAVVSQGSLVPSTKNRVKISYPVSGKYTTVFTVFSADSISKGTKTYKVNYIAQKNWKELGTVKYTDDYVSTAFPKVKQYEYDVTVEENKKHAGRYRLLNPYGKGYPQNAKGIYTTDTVSVYLEVNAEDAKGVYIPHNQAMNITLNAKTQGEMSVSSKAGKAIAEGKTLEEVKADSICGTMTKGIITFPKNSLLEYFPLKSSEWAEANVHGTFKLDLSAYVKAIKGDANDDGVVDVADITAIASYILGKTPEQWNADNADANSDNVIDVADITTTAGIILSK